MPARLPLARLLGFTLCLALLQGCAATAGSKSTDVAPISQPPEDSATVAQPPARPFRSSAPDEIVSEAVEGRRRLVVGDMLRTELVRSVEQGPLGIVRVGVGARFNSYETREFYFRQLASAYYTWTAENRPLIIELWEGTGKIGEYRDQAFHIGPRYTTPIDCPETATTGLCSVATAPDQTGAPAQQTSPTGRPTPAGASQKAQPPTDVSQRSGLHLGLGLGGGVVDFTCVGCDFPSETGFSGFLSLAGWVGEKTVLGVESTGWTKSESAATTQVYSVMAHATEYLSATSGLFLRAGVGLVGYREETDFGDRSAHAAGFSGRLGYELGAGRVALVPYVGLVRTFGGADVKLNGVNARLNRAISNLQFGLSIARH
jgi:hypothetical protein